MFVLGSVSFNKQMVSLMSKNKHKRFVQILRQSSREDLFETRLPAVPEAKPALRRVGNLKVCRHGNTFPDSKKEWWDPPETIDCTPDVLLPLDQTSSVDPYFN